MKVGRNDRCPCGSETKYKRCCGATADQAERLARSLAALEEAAELPRLFPHLRAEGDAIEAFAERVAREVAGGEVAAERLAEGTALLDEAERTRIVETFAREHPGDWKEIAGAAVTRAAAEEALLGGAVRAAVESRAAPSGYVLHAIQESELLQDNPLEALGLALPPARLWSIEDPMRAGDATIGRSADDDWLDAIEDAAEESWSDWHETRLAELVANLARHLPDPTFPRASAVLADACAELERDADAGPQVATVMLANYLVHLLAAGPPAEMRRALLAAAA